MPDTKNYTEIIPKWEENKMKKLLTLCLALAMTLSVGAYALTTLGSPVAKAADEAATGTSDTLTVKASEAYAYSTAAPDTHYDLVTSVASGTLTAVQNNCGMTLLSQKLTEAPNVKFTLATAVNADSYEYVTFKALYWANGGNYLNTTFGNLAGDKSVSSAVYGIQSKSVSPNSLWVTLRTADLKNAEGKVDGFIMTAPTFTADMYMAYFLISDFTFTNSAVTSLKIDYANSTPFTQDNFSGIQIWIDNGLRNRISNVSGTLKATVKFANPLPVDFVDYYSFKALIWGGNRSGLPFKVYPLGGNKVNQTARVFNYAGSDAESYQGNLDIRVAAKGLGNANGLVEGFDLEITNIQDGSHLIFSDITAVHEKTPSAILDEKYTTTENNTWGFQTSNWAGVPEWDKYELTYGGRDFVNSLYNIVLKYPVSVEKVKTIDFKAVLWNNAGVGQVQIAKIDGTNTEIINVNKGWTEVFEKNIDVKVNAELLADENGLVHGFRMNAINDDSGSFVFSKFISGTKEKVYNATLTLGDGTQENIAYTASNRAAKLEEVKAKLGTDDAQYTYSHNLPAELPFEEGKTYTETRTVNNYSVTFKNYDGETIKSETLDYGATPVAPETTPVKPYDDDNHFTFKGWDKEIAAVTGDVTYTAEFDAVAHVYGEWQELTAATCLEKGSHKKVCECGKEVVEETPAKGHTAVTDAAVAPTCTEPGKTEGSHCSVCNEVLTEQQTIAALGHDMGEYVQTTAPTCTEKGVKTATCKREGCDHTETQEIPAKGHTLEKVEAVAATESKEGVKEHYKCAECGKLFLDENGTTPATEADLKIEKLEKKGCSGAVDGFGFLFAAVGMAFVALKKKRG